MASKTVSCIDPSSKFSWASLFDRTPPEGQAAAIGAKKIIPQQALFAPTKAVVVAERPALDTEKVAEKLRHIQEVLTLEESSEKLRVIQMESLGSALSECAAYLNRAPSSEETRPLKKQTIDIATNLLECLSIHYFYESEEWGFGRSGLERSDSAEANEDVEQVQRAVNALPEQRNIFTWVVAKDDSRKCIWVSRSGRMWALNRTDESAWVQTQADWLKVIRDKPLRFTELLSNPVTNAILRQISSHYVECCRINREHEHVTHFTNFNKIRGDFANEIAGLLETRKSSGDRRFIISTLKRAHLEALPERRWTQLLGLSASDDEQKAVKGVVMAERTSPQEAVAMSLSSVFCGEIKIALDICRDLGTLSLEKRKLLPRTMGERLTICAFTTEQDKMSSIRRRMEICTKCREMWPILEALYWSIRVSGMDISAIEKLSS